MGLKVVTKIPDLQSQTIKIKFCSREGRSVERRHWYVKMMYWSKRAFNYCWCADTLHYYFNFDLSKKNIHP
jgi:hypothetical protein